MKTKHTNKFFALLLAIFMVVAILPFSAITAFAREGLDLKIAIYVENYFDGVSEDTISVTASSTSVFKDGFLISKKANEGSTPVQLADGEILSSSVYSYMVVLEFANTPDATVTENTFTVSGATVKNKTIVTAGTKTVLSIELAPPTPFYVNSVELEGANIAVGKSLTVPTVKSVNGEEKYKDLVSIDYVWYSIDDAETEGILDPGGFAWSDPLDAASVTVTEGIWYDLQISLEQEGIAVFASDCEMVFENVAGYDTTIALDIDEGTGYADIIYVPITYHSNYPGEIADETYTEFAIYGENYIHSFDEDPFSVEGYSLRGYVHSLDAPHSYASGSPYLLNVNESFEFYAYWDKILDQVTFTLSGYEIGKSVSDISISDGGVEFTPVDGMVGTNKVWNIVEGSFDPQKFFEGGMNEADAPQILSGNFEADKEYWLVIGSTDWEGIEQPYVYPMTTEGYTLDSEYSARYFFAMGEGATAMFKLPKLHAHGTGYKIDADNHWNECACGDKANVAAHADANADGKCDVCSYAIPTTAPDNNGNAGSDSGNATPDSSADTSTNDNENTDETETQTETDDTNENEDETEPEKKNGCGSTLALSSLAIVGLIGSAIVIKKKED